MKLAGYTRLTSYITLRSGLHIGTGEKEAKGESAPVIESKRTGMPYIPGSSLKGKMRHLLEITYGRKETMPLDSGSPCCCGNCNICILFGSGNARTTHEPSRLIFRDCYLEEKSEELIRKVDLEDKPGVRIDREKGKAAERAVLPIKRVPEGCEFFMEISVRMFEKDNAEGIRKWLAQGLYLMEQDAIGGGGTRGSGQIEFNDIEFNGQKFVEDWREECKKMMTGMADVNVRLP
jgi:CRISPR-associated protein Csm3